MFELIFSVVFVFILLVAYLGYKGVEEVIEQKNLEYQIRLKKSFDKQKEREGKWNLLILQMMKKKWEIFLH